MSNSEALACFARFGSKFARKQSIIASGQAFLMPWGRDRMCQQS